MQTAFPFWAEKDIGFGGGGGAPLAAQWWRIHLSHGINPWFRKIPNAIQQMGLCTTATEAELWSSQATSTESACHSYWNPSLEPVLCYKRSHCNEKPAHCSERKPEQWWRPSAAKNKLILKRSALAFYCDAAENAGSQEKMTWMGQVGFSLLHTFSIACSYCKTYYHKFRKN